VKNVGNRASRVIFFISHLSVSSIIAPFLFGRRSLTPQLQTQTRQCRRPSQAGRSSNLSSRCLRLRLQRFRSNRRIVEQVTICSGNGQSPSDHNSTTNLLNRLNFPTPTRGTVVKVSGNGVPRAVGQGRCALLSGLEVSWVNGA